MSINIGDILYAYDSFKGGHFEYEVICIRVYENEKNKYEIECKNCKHNEPCRLLVVESEEDGLYRFVEMLNDTENEHYYWHSDKTFYKSKKKCFTTAYNQKISYLEKEIDKMIKTIETYKIQIENLKFALELIEDK